MIPAEPTPEKYLRDIRTAKRIRIGFAVTAMVFFGFRPFLDMALGELPGMIAFIAIVWAWISLARTGARQAQGVAPVPHLLAAGRFSDAHDLILATLSSPPRVRAPRVLAMHYLAMLRHAQHRFPEAAVCARLALQTSGRESQAARVTTQLVLAESLLAMGDVQGAFLVLREVPASGLPFANTLALLAVQCDYLAYTGQWSLLAQDARAKCELAGGLPPLRFAIVNATISMACSNVGDHETARWLLRRAGLVKPLPELAQDRPWLAPIGTADAA